MEVGTVLTCKKGLVIKGATFLIEGNDYTVESLGRMPDTFYIINEAGRHHEWHLNGAHSYKPYFDIKPQSDFIRQHNKKVPLDKRIESCVFSYFLQMNGYPFLIPEDSPGIQNPEVRQQHDECIQKASSLSRQILDEVKQWQDDGAKFTK